MKTIPLKEYDFLQCKESARENYISPTTFTQLEKFVLDNQDYAQYLKLTTKPHYGKILQAQNYVGLIQTKDGTTIEILPKIGDKETLLKMLKTLKKSPFKSINTAHLKTRKMPLLEIFISMFLEELAKLIQRGIKSGYITKDENLKFLKGKLIMSQHIRQNFIHKERFYVEYQEWLCDRVENRLIKTTLNYLYKRSRSNTNQQRIREFLFVFDGIGMSKNIKSDFDKVHLDRQMRDYEQVLLWCRTFLLRNSFTPYRGSDVAFALLFDMNMLFESYVGAYLKKYLHGSVHLQHHRHYLAYTDEGNEKFKLRPDIVIDEGKIIADTKWKILSEEKTNNRISQSDLYQMFAYGKKYESEQLFLIYPKDKMEKHEAYDFYQEAAKSLPLIILFFDLKKDFSDDGFALNFEPIVLEISTHAL